MPLERPARRSCSAVPLDDAGELSPISLSSLVVLGFPLYIAKFAARLAEVEASTKCLMDDKPSGSQSSAVPIDTSAPTESPAERRRNVALRRLIDEMLGQVRHIHSSAPLWTPEERAQAEAELEMIMARVRREASGP